MKQDPALSAPPKDTLLSTHDTKSVPFFFTLYVDWNGRIEKSSKFSAKVGGRPWRRSQDGSEFTTESFVHRSFINQDYPVECPRLRPRELRQREENLLETLAFVASAGIHRNQSLHSSPGPSELSHLFLRDSTNTTCQLEQQGRSR